MRIGHPAGAWNGAAELIRQDLLREGGEGSSSSAVGPHEDAPAGATVEVATAPPRVDRGARRARRDLDLL